MTQKKKPSSTTIKAPAEPSYRRCKLNGEDLEMNARCAKWAKKVLKELERLVGTSRGDAVADMLQYMMHLCDRDEEYGDFDEAMESAISAYERFITPHPNWQDR